MAAEMSQKDRAADTLRTMFGYLGLKADVNAEERDNRVVLKISSPDAGRIIGRKGQTLESLQTLLNRIMFRGEDSPRISLDIDGYAAGNNRGERHSDEEGEERPRSFRRREEGEGGRHAGVPQEQLRSQALDAGKEIPVTISADELCEILKEQFKGGYTYENGVTGEKIAWEKSGYVNKSAIQYVIKEAK